jgi:hypothetical protein
MTTRSREQLVAEIRADRAFWRALRDEVGRERMNEPGPMGDWTFRDLAAHLAGWRNLRIAQLEAAGRGAPQPPTPWPADLDDDDRINDWIQEQNRDRSLEDVLDDYDSTFERLAAALEGLTDDQLTDTKAFDWTDGTPLIESEPASHLHDEHLPGVRAWLASRPSRI